MFRHDFDLALDLVEPLVAGSREAQKLMGRIVDKRAADRLSRRRVNLLYPVLLAAAVFLVVVVVNVRRYYLERAEENGGLVAGMTEKLNRSAELHAGVGIQTQYTVIYQDLVFRRADLGRCAGYQPLFDFLTSIYDEMLNAQSGQEGTRRDVYRRLAANAPLFKALREDLMSEGDPYVRGKNADLENRLADMEGLLAEYRF